jgi:hypothetical protein
MHWHFIFEYYTWLNRIVAVEECDATEDDSSTKDRYIIILALVEKAVGFFPLKAIKK